MSNTKGQKVFYVYCIGEQKALAPLLENGPPMPIERGAGFELVVSGHLAGVVSAVPARDYGERWLQVKLEDPAWTASRAMRHEEVVEYFAARATVIPLRFGTVFLERVRVAETISEKADLRAVINRLRGRQEWGINIYCNRQRLAKVIAKINRTLKELTERAASASAGQAYLLKKKIDLLRAEIVRSETKRIAGEIERELDGSSEGAARLQILKGEATEKGELVAKLAFLVPRDSFDRFRLVAERLARENVESGFYLDLSGPWPIYNFVDRMSLGRAENGPGKSAAP